MPRVPFHYIDLRTFCYETEDEKRVEEALRTFLPDEFDVDRVESTGHHGDRIIVFSARVERANDVRHLLDKIRDLPDFETLLDELDQRVTDNTEFFLRLDKQAAFKGEARRGGGLTLRAKVEAYPAKKEAAVENARDALLGDE
ncbi:RNA-binding protein [Haloferax volcanii]|uniref:RNA-binding protein n=1 Tax=Haloferax volcanii TaxID=2246 RepID=UPI00349FB223